MKTKKRHDRPFLALLVILTLCVGCSQASQSTSPEKGNASKTQQSESEESAAQEIGPVEREVDRIIADMQRFLENERPASVEELDPFFKRFEKLYEEHAKERPEEATMALMTPINLYVRFFGLPAKALPYFERLAEDYAGTPTGKNAEENLAGLKDFLTRQAEREKLMTAQMEAMMARRKAEQEAAGIVVGKPMPDFKREDQQGKEMSLSALKGDPVLLVFWASWCGPCMQEAPNIKAVYEEFKDRGLKVLGINKDDSPVAMERVVEKMAMPWPQHQDLDDSLGVQFAASALPTIYLIDRDGSLAATGMDVRGPNLREAVAKLFEK